MSYDSGAKVSLTTPPHKTLTCPNFSRSLQPNTNQPTNVAYKYVFTGAGIPNLSCGRLGKIARNARKKVKFGNTVQHGEL